MVTSPRYDKLEQAADDARRYVASAPPKMGRHTATMTPTADGLGVFRAQCPDPDDAWSWIRALSRLALSRLAFRDGSEPRYVLQDLGARGYAVEGVVPVAWATQLGVPLTCACGAELEGSAACTRCAPQSYREITEALR